MDTSLEVQQFVLDNMDASKLRELPNIELKLLYAAYQKKNENDLTNSEKILLSKIIIHHLLGMNIKLELSKEDFEYLASVISEVFPSEIEEDYFKRDEDDILHSGKLYESYLNTRKRLTSAHLIRTRKRQRTINLSTSVIEPEGYEDLNFVKENTGPFEVLVEKWKNCFALRRKILEDKEVKTAEFVENEYLSQFQIYHQNDDNILKLFYEDCKILYPKMKSHITWDVYESILEKGKELKLPREVSKWVSEAEQGDDGLKITVSLLVLPYLFPSVRHELKTEGRSVKVPMLVVQENFILFFKTDEQAEEYERSVSAFKCEIQPRVIFIGSLRDLTIYVTLLDRKYYCKDPLEAIEQCFFIYQALNLKFPEESNKIWNFIKIYFFNLRKKDTNYSVVRKIRQSLQSNSWSAETSIKDEEI